MLSSLNNNKTMKTPIQNKMNQAFSLVELLVVIAVIAIIAAIAIPNISTITDSATDSKDRRNAQNIASVYSAARAAGHPADASLAAALGAVTNTISVPVGAETLTFSVDGITQADIDAATDAGYLTWDGTRGLLIYDQGS